MVRKKINMFFFTLLFLWNLKYTYIQKIELRNGGRERRIKEREEEEKRGEGKERENSSTT